MKDLFIKTDSLIIYQDNYIELFDKFKKVYIEHHKSRGYQRINTNMRNTFYGDILSSLPYKKIDFIKDFAITSFALFNDEISARSEALVLLNEYNNIVKKMLSFFMVDGYLRGDENSLISGVFDYNGKFHKLYEVNIVNKSYGIIVVSKCDDSFIKIIDEYHHKFNLLSSQISLYKYGIVLYENTDKESLEVKKKIESKFDVLNHPTNLSLKEKYGYLEERGVNIIFEIKKKGRLSVKYNFLNQKEDIDILDIDNFNHIFNKGDNKLYNLFLDHYISTSKESNNLYLCKECFDKYILEHDDELFIKLFHQRLNGKRCNICFKEAYVNLLILETY